MIFTENNLYISCQKPSFTESHGSTKGRGSLELVGTIGVVPLDRCNSKRKLQVHQKKKKKAVLGGRRSS